MLLSFACRGQIITTVLGTYRSAISDPQYLALDIFGNLYCPTRGGNTVLKVDTNGVVTVFAGIGTAGFSGDNGPATLAKLYQPTGVTTDTFGNLYIADNGNHRIRKVDAGTGIINTIAGNDTSGFGGDNGPASAATLYTPVNVYFDKFGNLYIADAHGRIRKINSSDIITTVAGNGIIGYSGDGGPATAAMCEPEFTCTDISGNIYFGDGMNNTIRKIDTSGLISTIAGDSSGMYVYNGDERSALGASMDPVCIAFDKDGLLVISDSYNSRIRKIDNAGIIHTVAGNGVSGYSGDNGPATSAEINRPSGIVFDNCGNLFIAQINQPCIRKVSFNPYCWPERIQNITKSNPINIYPNPASDILHIDNIETKGNYRLLSIEGEVMQKGCLKEGSNIVSVNLLPESMYVIEVTNDSREKIITKIVKQ